MSARDTIRLEEAIANATAEFVVMWTASCNARHHIMEPIQDEHTEMLIEKHSFIINTRLREILRTLQISRTIHSKVMRDEFETSVRDALRDTHLKAETVDDLIHAAMV
ncbi:MAG: hypothetical protein RLZZ234_27 [Candidatus Parcubacteria bacterium]|jgi:hypothetical protein